MMKTILPATAIFFAAAMPALAPAEDQPIDAGDAGILVRQGQEGTLAAAVSSPESRILTLARLAFRAHGAYELRDDPEGCDFLFLFEPVNAVKVKLTIKSGAPPKTLFSKEVNGSDWGAAALRAADLAIAKTLGLPGFFAGKLAFVCDNTGATEICVSDLFFENVTRITKDRAKCMHPELSPCGRKLLYTSYYRNGFPDIYQVDLESGRRAPFAEFKGTNTGAAFNPAGDAVALILSGAGNAELYVCGASGGNMRRLARTDGLEADPAWSPGGDQIIFASDEPGKPQLHIISAAGGKMSRIPANISGYCAEPAWNPRKENEIAFTCASGKEFEIALYDMEKKESRILTKGQGDAVEPCWTNDGRHLIYTERAPGHRRLVLFDTVTGKKTPLHKPDFGNTSQASFVYP